MPQFRAFWPVLSEFWRTDQSTNGEDVGRQRVPSSQLSAEETKHYTFESGTNDLIFQLFVNDLFN